MKSKRQAKIMEIIATTNVETQEQLLQQLQEAGFTSTQATISRDIKELHLVKIPYGHGKYRYSFPVDVKQVHSESKMQKAFQDSVLKVEASENIIVIRTQPGAGAAVAFALDNAQWPEIIGTVAGDDTVLAVLKDKEKSRGIVAKMREMSMGCPV